MSRRVAIQGFAGCFHEEAARRFYKEHFDEIPEIVECATFDDLFKEMEKGNADAAIMAASTNFLIFIELLLSVEHDRADEAG